MARDDDVKSMISDCIDATEAAIKIAGKQTRKLARWIKEWFEELQVECSEYLEGQNRRVRLPCSFPGEGTGVVSTSPTTDGEEEDGDVLLQNEVVEEIKEDGGVTL